MPRRASARSCAARTCSRRRRTSCSSRACSDSPSPPTRTCRSSSAPTARGWPSATGPSRSTTAALWARRPARSAPACCARSGCRASSTRRSPPSIPRSCPPSPPSWPPHEVRPRLAAGAGHRRGRDRLRPAPELRRPGGRGGHRRRRPGDLVAELPVPRRGGGRARPRRRGGGAGVLRPARPLARRGAARVGSCVITTTVSPAVITELADAARQGGRLGIDTEFMGEGRYRSLLCLVQVAVPNTDGSDGVRVEVLDPLDDRLDPAPLAEVLADPSIGIVMHAGRQDVALLRRVWHTEVRGLFDTQVAAGFAGLPAQAGYETLLREMLNVRLRKTASYTRWDARPLSDEQVAYAREDVLHLLQLADALQERLAQLGRLEWAREEGRPLEASSDERDVETAFARLPRINGLDPAARAVAYELALWREELAARQDRPVQSVLGDAPLVEVAKRKPSSTGQLENIRGINPGNLRKRGQDILDAVARGREREPIPYEGERRPPPDAGDAPLIALGEALVRTRAAEAGLAYELVAARADLQAVVGAVRGNREEPAVRTLQGSRRALVGSELLSLLAGELSLSIDGGHKIVVQDT